MEDIPKSPPESGKYRTPVNDFVVGLVIFLIALYALIESIKMPYYEQGERGPLSSPGLTPGLLSLGLMVMALVLMFRGRANKFNFRLKLVRPAFETWRVLIVLLILVTYVALLRPLGYTIATFLMMAIFQFVFARRRTLSYVLLYCLGLSAVVTSALYFVFAVFFLIPIP